MAFLVNRSFHNLAEAEPSWKIFGKSWSKKSSQHLKVVWNQERAGGKLEIESTGKLTPNNFMIWPASWAQRMPR